MNGNGNGRLRRAGLAVAIVASNTLILMRLNSDVSALGYLITSAIVISGLVLFVFAHGE